MSNWTHSQIQQKILKAKMDQNKNPNNLQLVKREIQNFILPENMISPVDTQIIQNGVEGKRRRFIIKKTTPTENTNALYQQWNSTSSDGSVVFKIINQPEIQHRARYQTEGSRGAIKDRTGTGYPTVQIQGCRKATRIQIFIGNDNGKVMPHMFYQACRVTGKNSNPCDEKNVDGTDVLEIPVEANNDRAIICDCVGILKERFADVEARFPKHKTWRNTKKKSTKCRLIFRTIVENQCGEKETLQVVSDVINCTQLPGTPEILKMSTTASNVEGGGELWIIGKNFLKDTRVIFSYSVAGKSEPLWTKFAEPEQEYFHQSHLIVQIPAFYNFKIEEDIEISVFIRCGEKLSDPQSFTYRAKAVRVDINQGLITVSSSNSMVLPPGVAAPAVEINQQYAKTGSVSVSSVSFDKSKVSPTNTPQPRPTILEPLYDHKTKKSKIDFRGPQPRRTRSVPRPNLIDEDAMFMSDQMEGNNGSKVYTSFSHSPFSPWKGVTKITGVVSQSNNVNLVQSHMAVKTPLASPPLMDKTETPQSFICVNKLSFSTEESSSSNYTKDEIKEESSQSTCKSDISSSLTSDFSKVFDFKSGQSDRIQQLSSFNVHKPLSIVTQASSPDSMHMVDIQPVENKSDPLLKSTEQFTEPILDSKTDIASVSYEATNEDKATISISLPTSILKDQKHFQNVIETLNNTLIKQTKAHEEVTSITEEQNITVHNNVGDSHLFTFDDDKSSPDSKNNSHSPGRSHEPLYNRCSTSPQNQPHCIPVSVLKVNTRKRSLSSEPIIENSIPIECDNTLSSNNQTHNIDETTILNNSVTSETVSPTNILSNSSHLQYENENTTILSDDKGPELFVTNFQERTQENADQNSPASSSITEDYAKWTITPSSTQEKKWNDEFNEVLQTVIEETKDNNKDCMDWTHSKANMQPPQVPGSMDWSSDCILQSDKANESVIKENKMEWTSNENKCLQMTFDSKTENISSDINSLPTEPQQTTVLTKGPIENGDPNEKNSYITSDLQGSLESELLENIVQECEKRPTKNSVSDQKEYINNDETVKANQQFEEYNTSTIQDIYITDEPTPEIEKKDFLQSKSHLTKYQVSDLSIFDESPGDIASDPFLSETSSAIGAQKDIESVNISNVQVNKSDAMRDQQWGLEPTSDWSYNATE